MITLFIDSTRTNLFVSIIKNNDILMKKNVQSYSKHSNYLMNTINDIFKELKMDINAIENIVVLNGPGSFTGIRVGVTVAKTIAWTLSKKIYTLSTLEALKIHSDNDQIISVIEDRNNYAYIGLFNENEKIMDYMSLEDERLNMTDKNISLVSYNNSEILTKIYNKLSNNNNVNVVIVQDYDYIKLVNYATKKEPENVHSIGALYLKKIDAEK